MKRWNYSKGLHDLGNGAYAYLQPDGSWGWSNAGLVVDGGESLLVDTLFDERLTADMLKIMKNGVGLGGKDIDVLVNTHANPDHTFGNRLVTNAEIIASEAAAEEMTEDLPAMLAKFVRDAPNLGAFGEYYLECFGDFDFEGVQMAMPTKTFSGNLDVKVGNKVVKLLEVGPAHTAGDVLVWVPEDKTVFTGDILFVNGTPIMWEGPISNWIRACNKILELDVETIVPGHGPITDKKGVRAVIEYLTYIDVEARKRYDAGLSVIEAIHDISLSDYSSWCDAERIAVNVDTLYREYSGDTSPRNMREMFVLMSQIAKK